MLNMKNKKLKIKKLILIILILGVTVSVLAFPKLKSKNSSESIKDKLIRFHVIANSDSAEDQALKRRIRDKIIEKMSAAFEGVESIEQSKQIIEEYIKEIEETAKEEIIKSGKAYDVKAELGEFGFPTKNYGIISLPAGKYQALRVVIGKGQGANWWCVLFPPLCFVDITQGLTSEKTKAELKRALTEEETKKILSQKEPDNVSVEVKFKFLEMIKGVTAKLADK